jgi:putative transposase
MNQAYATRDTKRARRLLEGLARRLEHQHPGAASSLREGLEETLTVMRLGLPENLERVLSSTNLIENLFSRVGEIGRRVKRWQNGTMVLRWTAAGALEASVASANSSAIVLCQSCSPRCVPVMLSSSAARRLMLRRKPLN